MPSHGDAVGYLNDLVASEDTPWFTMICDMVMYQGVGQLSQDQLDSVARVYCGEKGYERPQKLQATVVNTERQSGHDRLERLSQFTNFKGLKDTLEVAFPTSATVIFGTNGSGKSSLCEALRVLGSPESPIRPLHNVKVQQPQPTTFSFDLQSANGPQTWIESVGFGVQSTKVKFFDTAVADRSVSNYVEPGKVVRLSPYRLYLFEDVRATVVQFKEHLEARQAATLQSLEHELEIVRSTFAKDVTSVLHDANIDGVVEIPKVIANAKERFNSEAVEQSRAYVRSLNLASTEEGTKLLIAEKEGLDRLSSALAQFIEKVRRLWALDCASKSTALTEKEAAQRVLLEGVRLPNGSTDGVRALVESAAEVCDLEHPEGQVCPLCRQGLDEKSLTLFRRYHKFLVDNLQGEITALRDDLAQGASLIGVIADQPALSPLRNLTIEEVVRIEVGTLTTSVLANCSLHAAPNIEATVSVDRLGLIASDLEKISFRKSEALQQANASRKEKLDALHVANANLAELILASKVIEQEELLRNAIICYDEFKKWNPSSASFSGLLNKLTRKSRAAHEELMVTDFEDCLNREYIALTERTLESFGVELSKRGSEASIQIRPKVGEQQISSVLSEGELRVHALVLFFAELENSSHPIIILDDPVTSFDYDYISNFCNRLRDFLRQHPDRQLIVLTHNWEFFVNLQLSLNKGGFSQRLSVQVIENCATVSEYTEKLDELKQEIESTLCVPAEPNRTDKERLAGNMRRLIESIINTFVFAGQRHQFKQRSQTVSLFEQYTKLVPLTDQEASGLKDLYEKLSITEHDDIRNVYVNSPKAVFQTRYDKILQIEQALQSRRR